MPGPRQRFGHRLVGVHEKVDFGLHAVFATRFDTAARDSRVLQSRNGDIKLGRGQIWNMLSNPSPVDPFRS
jgi:hypothetical protein